MDPFKILISDQIHGKGIDYLKANGCVVDSRFDISPDDLKKTVSDYEVLIVRSRTKVTSDVIGAGTRLKVIARAGSGVDNIDMEAAKARKITVINARGANAEAVSEHVLAFMLMLSRNMFPAVSGFRSGTWAKKTYNAIELEGKTLGIIGLGAIGNRVAQLARSFGMAVVSFTRTTNDEKMMQIELLGGRFVSLDELLTTSDIVSLHVPLTPETTHMIGGAQLSKMKKTAYLINASRGAVVDEQALVTALKNRIIAGAALDVFGQEPLPADSPLRTLTNTIATPHVASVSAEGASRISQMLAEDIVRLQKGEPPKRLA